MKGLSMKYLLYSLLFICSCAAQAGTSWEERLNPRENVADQGDQLQKIRETVAAQTAQIKGILETVCDALRRSDLPTKDSLCRELSLLRDFVQHLASAIPSMHEQELVQLTRVNALVLEELMRQLEHGDLQGMCSINVAKITHTPREWLNLDQLENLALEVQNHIAATWNIVTGITLAQPASYAEQAWNSIKDNQGALILTAAVAVGTTWAIKSIGNGTAIKDVFKRLLTYDLLALYLLRQKKDKDIAELAQQWFGENSRLAAAMLTLKQWVGSPKEKKTAVHVIARNDMTAQEQIDWADEQNCAVVKVEKGRDCDFLKNFFEFDDGLYKISFGLLFAQQLKDDIDALSGILGNGATTAHEFLKFLIDTYKPKK
jgi:hypothetical protein